MNTYHILGAVALVAVLGGGGYYVTTMQGGVGAAGDMYEKVADSVAGAISKTGSLIDLTKMGGDYTCTIKTGGIIANVENKTEGTVWVSGSDYRGSFVTTVLGRTVTTESLKIGDTMYSWGSALPTGIMIKLTNTTEQQFDQANLPKMQDGFAQAGQQFAWECTKGADLTKLVKPENVQFTDMDSMMKSIKMPAIPSY